MESVHLQLPAGLLAELDLRRGDVARNRWIRRAIEERLERENNAVLDRIAPVRSSGQAKRDVRPVPKGRQ